MARPTVADWRILLRENFTHIDKLADFLELSAEQKQQLAIKSTFNLNVPKRLAEKMIKGSLDDPLLRQFVPLTDENARVQHFIADPVGDAHFRQAPKLLHKYNGRALLLCTSACAMHCRYCFRQNFEYETQNKGFTEELSLIAKDPSLKEIILSGGDPLSLSDATLELVLSGLAAIPHITRVRFHTRFPIGIPERLTDSFIALLHRFQFSYWFIVHINHPKELDKDVIDALKKLTKSGIPVLNQAVLLKGVNDSVEILKELCEKLIDNGFVPYYLHQLDRVNGAQHFEVEEILGRRLVNELAKELPGYGVPKYVKEICGEPHKTPIK